MSSRQVSNCCRNMSKLKSTRPALCPGASEGEENLCGLLSSYTRSASLPPGDAPEVSTFCSSSLTSSPPLSCPSSLVLFLVLCLPLVFCPRARCWPKAACSIAHGLLPCTPTHHLLSSVLSQATPPKTPSYSAGALPGIDTQGSYNSVTRYSTSNSLSVNRSITFTHAQQSTALRSHSCFELI